MNVISFSLLANGLSALRSESFRFVVLLYFFKSVAGSMLKTSWVSVADSGLKSVVPPVGSVKRSVSAPVSCSPSILMFCLPPVDLISVPVIFVMLGLAAELGVAAGQAGE